jgi:RimJ/RimL family protein N-acetyltransferase
MQLRPLRDGDLQDLHAHYGDRDLMRFITGAPRTLAQTTSRLSAHLDDHRRHGFGLCAVFFKDGDKMIGRCGLATLRLSRVFAIADHRNTSSIALMKKVGMTLAETTMRGVEYEMTP